MSRRRKPAEVPLKRDANWWLHPAYRGEQSLPLESAPHRWVRSDLPAVRAEPIGDDTSPYTDLAQVLYRLNGCRPGPVRGFYVVVGIEEGRYAVGQLCADQAVPVQLFEDHVYASEDLARAAAARLRAENPAARGR